MATPPIHSQCLLPNPDLRILDGIERDADRFRLLVHVEQIPSCPLCGEVSRSRHSNDRRRLQDLPWQGVSVQLWATVGRFRCARLAIGISDDTVLRRVQKKPAEPVLPLHNLGVDDWAWRKSQEYGTILVNWSCTAWSNSCRIGPLTASRSGFSIIPKSKPSPAITVPFMPKVLRPELRRHNRSRIAFI